MTGALVLTDADERKLAGDEGAGMAMAMRMIVALAAAEVYGIRMPILLLDGAARAELPRSGAVTVSAADDTAAVSWSTSDE